MPLIRINARPEGPMLHGSAAALEPEIARRGGEGPAIVMIHGYSYHPGRGRHCPHRNLLSMERLDDSAAWPRHLGFGGGHAGEGLAVAFGWEARGTPWTAQRRAAQAGRSLAQVIQMLKAQDNKRPVHVIAHSMGVELALEALHHLPAHSVGRILSLTGAAHLSRTRAALETQAGRTAEFVNVTSRENDAFDFLFERLVAPPHPGDRAISHGLDAANAVTVQIDCPDTLAHLNRMGAPVAGPDRLVCHWSAYARPGMLPFCNALLRRPDRWSLDALRAGLPAAPASRWSRLFPSFVNPLPLPGSQKAA
ncbi:MAG: alpha/beta hydrolase [Pseudooceanicola sp.]|nr:alpha/beta hydrolase [Pseudooceanicola sp.]